MTGTGTQTTGVTTIALLVLRTGELKIKEETANIITYSLADNKREKNKADHS